MTRMMCRDEASSSLNRAFTCRKTEVHLAVNRAIPGTKEFKDGKCMTHKKRANEFRRAGSGWEGDGAGALALSQDDPCRVGVCWKNSNNLPVGTSGL